MQRQGPDRTGSVLFSLLSDTITPYGAHHIQLSYLVNATYVYNGTQYNSSGDINNKYTQIVPERLVNGTGIVKKDIVSSVFIKSALPELDPPFWASTYAPTRGAIVNLTANVSNTGVVTAYNILVRFRDVTTTR